MQTDGDGHFLIAYFHVTPLLVGPAPLGPVPVGPSQCLLSHL